MKVGSIVALGAIGIFGYLLLKQSGSSFDYLGSGGALNPVVLGAGQTSARIPDSRTANPQIKVTSKDAQGTAHNTVISNAKEGVTFINNVAATGGRFEPTYSTVAKGITAVYKPTGQTLKGNIYLTKGSTSPMFVAIVPK